MISALFLLVLCFLKTLGKNPEAFIFGLVFSTSLILLGGVCRFCSCALMRGCGVSALFFVDLEERFLPLPRFVCPLFTLFVYDAPHPPPLRWMRPGGNPLSFHFMYIFRRVVSSESLFCAVVMYPEYQVSFRAAICSLDGAEIQEICCREET